MPYLWFAPLDVRSGRHVRAAHARRADGGALRNLQARSGGAVLPRPLPALLAPDRAGRRAARAAGGPRRLRRHAARARRHSGELPLRSRRHSLQAAARTAHRQGPVRRHQGGSCARHSARPSRGVVAEHGGLPCARGQEQQRAVRGDGACVGHLDRGGHPGDRRPAPAGGGRPAGGQHEAGEILRRQCSDPSAARRCLGLAVPQRAGVRAARRSIPRRSKGSRTSISTWRSNSCWETGCDDRSIRPQARRSPRA